MDAVSSRFITAAMLLIAAVGAARGEVGPSELWKINADGTGLARFIDTPGETCGSPEWSPDGKFVAYGAWKVGQSLNAAHVFVVGADGKGVHDLGPGAMASWSPDSKQLVFHTYPTPADQALRIVVMNADGSGRKNLLDHWGSPRWSRKGDRIFSILDDNIALYDRAAGTEHTILPKAYPMYWGFGVSPDGKRVCFSGRDRGLYLASLDEKSKLATVQQLLAEGKSTYVSFAPDGKQIVFSYAFSSRWMQLFTMDVDADKKPKRLPGQDKSRLNWGPDWSPDGKTIIFGSKATD